jgi:hypothetical protein
MGFGHGVTIGPATLRRFTGGGGAEVSVPAAEASAWAPPTTRHLRAGVYGRHLTDDVLANLFLLGGWVEVEQSSGARVQRRR